MGQNYLTLARAGDDPAALAPALGRHAVVLYRLGRYPEAEGLFLQALKIDRATIGEAHPDYATRLNNLAWVLVKLECEDEARALCQQALAIFRATLPPDHPQIRTVQGHLSKLP